jgi:glycosyltransferase involved in cell wall biosynthesis
MASSRTAGLPHLDGAPARKDSVRLPHHAVCVIDVVLPVLNEAAALPWVLSRVPNGFTPIVVDNASTDGSAVLARSLGARVISEPRRGFGAACFAGLSASTSEVVCFMDCDRSLDPGLLASVASPILEGCADLVLGRRRPERGAWPMHARAANALLTLEIRRRTGLHLRDIGPMRAARRDALLSLSVRDRGFGWPLEMVLQAARAGWTIHEVPVPLLARAGRSKVTGTVRGTARAVRDMAKVLR